jgi:aflatoxin B1 aldehyde reductase
MDDLQGAGQFGAVGTHERVSDPSVAQGFLDLMINHGQTGIDTSRIYCQGTSEKVSVHPARMVCTLSDALAWFQRSQLVSELDFKGVIRVDTKNYPAAPGDHSPEKLKEAFKASLDALNGKKIRVFYLHAPDRSVPFEDTLEAVNDIWKSGGL